MTIDPSEPPKSAAELYPQSAVRTLAIPSSAGDRADAAISGFPARLA